MSYPGLADETYGTSSFQAKWPTPFSSTAMLGSSTAVPPASVNGVAAPALAAGTSSARATTSRRERVLMRLVCPTMTDRATLEALKSKELHDRAIAKAAKHVDVRFFWRLFEAIPAAEAAIGEEAEAEADVMSW